MTLTFLALIASLPLAYSDVDPCDEATVLAILKAKIAELGHEESGSDAVVLNDRPLAPRTIEPQGLNSGVASGETTLPEGETWRVVGRRPDRYGGFLLTAEANSEYRGLENNPETGLNIFRHYPEIALALGIEVLSNRRIRYPDAQALNARLSHLLGRQNVPFRFREVQGALGPEQYLDCIADLELPYSVNRSEHFHDLQFHLMSFLLVPSSYWPYFQRRSEILLRALSIARHSDDDNLARRLEGLVWREARMVDLTSNLASRRNQVPNLIRSLPDFGFGRSTTSARELREQVERIFHNHHHLQGVPDLLQDVAELSEPAPIPLARYQAEIRGRLGRYVPRSRLGPLALESYPPGPRNAIVPPPPSEYVQAAPPQPLTLNTSRDFRAEERAHFRNLTHQDRGARLFRRRCRFRVVKSESGDISFDIRLPRNAGEPPEEFVNRLRDALTEAGVVTFKPAPDLDSINIEPFRVYYNDATFRIQLHPWAYDRRGHFEQLVLGLIRVGALEVH